METFLNLFLIVMALGGFFLAIFIFTSKRKAKPIACPMDGHCDVVVRSEFSKFSGIPIEILGILYYATIVLAYSVFYFRSDLAIPLVAFSMFGLTFSRFFFALSHLYPGFQLKTMVRLVFNLGGLSSFIFLSNIFYVNSVL